MRRCEQMTQTAFKKALSSDFFDLFHQKAAKTPNSGFTFSGFSCKKLHNPLVPAQTRVIGGSAACGIGHMRIGPVPQQHTHHGYMPLGRSAHQGRAACGVSCINRHARLQGPLHTGNIATAGRSKQSRGIRSACVIHQGRRGWLALSERLPLGMSGCMRCGGLHGLWLAKVRRLRLRQWRLHIFLLLRRCRRQGWCLSPMGGNLRGHGRLRNGRSHALFGCQRRMAG